MRTIPLFLAGAAVMASGVSCTPAVRAPGATAGSIPRVVGYFASWGVRTKGTRIADLPARDLTHIFYAFANIDDEGRVTLGDPCVDTAVCAVSARDSSAVPFDPETLGPGGNFGELARLKARNPHLKVLISVGGWTWSGKFSDAALSDASRRRFAKSAI